MRVLAVIVKVKLNGRAGLVNIGDTLGIASALAGNTQLQEEQGCQDADDGDDDQELNERKTFTAPKIEFFHIPVLYLYTLLHSIYDVHSAMMLPLNCISAVKYWRPIWRPQNPE